MYSICIQALKHAQHGFGIYTHTHIQRQDKSTKAQIITHYSVYMRTSSNNKYTNTINDIPLACPRIQLVSHTYSQRHMRANTQIHSQHHYWWREEQIVPKAMVSRKTKHPETDWPSLTYNFKRFSQKSVQFVCAFIQISPKDNHSISCQCHWFVDSYALLIVESPHISVMLWL